MVGDHHQCRSCSMTSRFASAPLNLGRNRMLKLSLAALFAAMALGLPLSVGAATVPALDVTQASPFLLHQAQGYYPPPDEGDDTYEDQPQGGYGGGGYGGGYGGGGGGYGGGYGGGGYGGGYGRLGCRDAARFIRRQGFRVVDFLDCSGSNYTFLARRGDGLFRVRVSSSGRIFSVSRASRY